MDFDFLWVLNDKDIKVELLDKVAFLSTKPKNKKSNRWVRLFYCAACMGGTCRSLLHSQKARYKGVGKDELLFADGEFYAQIFFVGAYPRNGAASEFFMHHIRI